MSGLDALDDGYARKAGFRYDKELSKDLELTIAGGFATRRVDHVLDLSARLFYKNYSPVTIPGMPELIPAVNIPGLLAGTTNWPTQTVSEMNMPSGFVRFQNYEEMPQDGSHIRAKISGVTDSNLEWALAGYAELYDTSLGHIGHSWVRDEFDLDFKANKPIGDFNHLSFGLSYRHISLDVDEVVTSPWMFPTFDLGTGTLRSDIPIIEYGNSPTEFERVAGFLQDSISLNEQFVLSLGAKFEDSDLSGSSIQPGARLSYTLDDQNIFGSLFKSLSSGFIS